MDRLCSKCGINPQSQGTSSWCKHCKSEYEATRRAEKGVTPKRKRNPEHLKHGLKECFKCDGVLPLDDFGMSKRGYAGRMAWCKQCCLGHAKTEARESMTVYTSRYRKGPNRGTYLLQHRQHQQKRRASKQSGSDGTVTTAFMVALYSEESCYYCGKYTPEKERTADHKNPIVRGGKHSKHNLVMSCRKCNSTKKDKTEEEFKACTKQG